MQAVIIAGGKGTRLQSVTAGLPKAMIDLGGRPLIEHQVLLAAKYGFRHVLVLTGYGAEHMERHCGDGSQWGVRITYHREQEPLGTAGAVLGAWDKLEERFLVLYGDTALNVNLRRMWDAHPSGAAATLFLHPNDHPNDSDLVEVDETSRVAGFYPYPHNAQPRRNLVNAALYVLDRASLGSRDMAGKDFGKHVFPALLNEGAHLHGYVSREYIKDAGTPERLQRVREDYASERIQNGALETAVSAVFLDRDGTINEERGFINSENEMHLLPGAAEAIRAINRSGRLAIVITNQPVIARGECTEQQLRHIHNRLEWLLGEQGAYVDAIYHCPHHPHSGYPGERADLKITCECRKPGVALFQQAAKQLNIDLSKSWMVGDRISDLQSAKRLGMRSGLVMTGPESERARAEAHPDHIFSDLRAATTFILS